MDLIRQLLERWIDGSFDLKDFCKTFLLKNGVSIDDYASKDEVAAQIRTIIATPTVTELISTNSSDFIDEIKSVVKIIEPEHRLPELVYNFIAEGANSIIRRKFYEKLKKIDGDDLYKLTEMDLAKINNIILLEYSEEGIFETHDDSDDWW